MKSMKNNKTPNNDGKFYKTIWDELKIPLMESINGALYTKILSISRRQAVITLVELDLQLE